MLSTPSELTTFELKAITKKGYNSQVTASVAFSIDLFIPGVIMTKKSNPEVLQLCYNAGWCASQDYMTEMEAKAVSDIGITFSNKAIKTFEELRLFTGLTSLASMCFSNCSKLTSIVIPESVTSLASMCFQNCSNLTSIVIPKGVTNIDSGCLAGCTKLTSITASNDNANYFSIDGVLFNKDKTSIILYPNAKSNEYVIPEGVTSIGAQCFAACANLTSIIIPERVTSLGNYCFSSCSNLASIVIPESVTSLGSDCFSRCSNLASIVIPESVTSLGSDCFYNCSKLASIVIPEGVTSLGTNCFYGCSSLTSILISEGVTSLGASCFQGCSKLTSIVIPEGITSIGAMCFYSCPSLTSITIKRNIAPTVYGLAFGTSATNYTGRNTFDEGTNILYVPAEATGYDTGEWLDPLCNAEKCGFTISYTL